jgi:AcrR family transcriptional regulator
MNKIIKNELSYLVFGEIYQKLVEPKQKRKAFSILEATVHCLAKSGFDHISLEMISREAGISRTLIHHYFDGIDDLEAAAVKYVRLLFQKLVVDSMLKESRADEMLTKYIIACFDWVETFRSHALVWLSFLHLSASQKHWRTLNTTAVNAGEERIAALLIKGREDGSLKFEGESLPLAKMIQILITGALVTSISENFTDPSAFRNAVVQQGLQLAGKPN